MRRRQDFADYSAVGLVVVAQSSEIEQCGPDVGFVYPCTGGSASGHGGLAAVGPGRARTSIGGRPVQTDCLDPWSYKAQVVGVDLGRIVTVVPGKTRVLGHAWAHAV